MDTFLMVAFLVAVVAFVAGTRSDQIMATLGPMFGVKSTSDTLDLASVQNVYRELKANYDGKLDKTALVDGASRGMVAAAGDRYTVFMDKKESDEFNKDLSGQVSGIGAEIGVRNGKATIIRVLSDSPAEKSGVLANDIIVAINDEVVDTNDPSLIAAKIRGEADTTVKVSFKRGNDLKEFSIVRATVSDASVRWKVVDGVGIMTMTRFDSDTGALARKAAEEFKAQQVKGVVLDLRDNGGGYLDQAKAVASLWLNDKLVVTEKTGDRVTDQLRSDSNPVLEGVKTIVLINGGSASASEIVAGALQDNGAATLVGEKTFGKGSVQKLITLADGRQLKVTIAKWYTPKNKNITKQGIAPDKEVKLTSEDMDAGRDPQLDTVKGMF